MEHFAKQIVLTCKEKVVLFGSVEEWRSRGAMLLCESAHKITFDEDNAEEEVLSTASS